MFNITTPQFYYKWKLFFKIQKKITLFKSYEVGNKIKSQTMTPIRTRVYFNDKGQS
jgi:hypothetical protein